MFSCQVVIGPVNISKIGQQITFYGQNEFFSRLTVVPIKQKVAINM